MVSGLLTNKGKGVGLYKFVPAYTNKFMYTFGANWMCLMF